MIDFKQWLAVLAVGSCLLNISCVTHQELISINGTQLDLTDSLYLETDSFLTMDQESYLLRPHDLLQITINTLEESTEQFLREQFSSGQVGGRNVYDALSMYYRSYEITEDGLVYLPIIDSVQVAGLTIEEVRRVLDKAFEPYLRFATTRVKLANMRVNVLGEVQNPGVQFIFDNQTSILEVLSLAGDFTSFANRKKVKLIRQTPNGKKSVFLNFFKPDFISGPYFYVQPNDIIYVEPIKSKAFDVGSRSVGIVLSVISTAALIANIILRGGELVY